MNTKEAVVSKTAVAKAEASPKDGEYQLLPREAIRPSATNPRKHFDPVKLEGLAKTIERLGIQMPLVVRLVTQEFTVHEPGLLEKQWTVLDRAGKVVKSGTEANVKAFAQGKDQPFYELVAGERRWRAAGMVKLAKVPAMVRNLSDADVLEIQYIENLQRDDLTALEEAEGFAKLIEMKLYTADTLADKLGKSRSHMFGRLALLKLEPKLKAAMAAGKLQTSMAALIGTVPGKEQQEELLEYVTDDWQTPSYRDLERRIADDYQRSLKKTTFDLEDAQLLPKAGVCSKCPKRSGNLASWEGNPNVCTDVACFDKKQSAAVVRQLEAAHAQGKKTVGPEEYEKARHGTFRKKSETCYEDPKRRTYGELAKIGAGVPALIAGTKDGVVEVFGRGEINQMMEHAGIKSDAQTRAINSKRKKSSEAKAAAEKLHNEQVSLLAVAQLEAVVGKKSIVLPVWKMLALKIAFNQGYMEKLGLRTRGELQKHVEKLTESELQVAVVIGEFCDDRVEYGGGFDSDFEAVCKAYGIDLGKLSKEVKAKAPEKAEDKPAAPAKKGKKK